MTDEEKLEETTSVPEEKVEAAPIEEPAVAESTEEPKCSKCGGPLSETGKCPVCDVETPTEA